MKYTKLDTIEALKKSGIMRGDTVFFTTSLGMLGVPDIKKINSINDICLFIFNSIKKVLGPNGTILVPTYSYSFGNVYKNKLPVFDPLKTHSKTGPFSNFFTSSWTESTANKRMIFGNKNKHGVSIHHLAIVELIVIFSIKFDMKPI